jgi:hypothetical protein
VLVFLQISPRKILATATCSSGWCSDSEDLYTWAIIRMAPPRQCADYSGRRRCHARSRVGMRAVDGVRQSFSDPVRPLADTRHGMGQARLPLPPNLWLDLLRQARAQEIHPPLNQRPVPTLLSGSLNDRNGGVWGIGEFQPLTRRKRIITVAK